MIKHGSGLGMLNHANENMNSLCIYLTELEVLHKNITILSMEEILHQLRLVVITLFTRFYRSQVGFWPDF